ncbi:hypothetical protein NGM36_15470 [Streptomyces mutabilis]|nr:hypothetical protein [Streptomyces mutabilis]MCZ9351178.1 hypothetical protein [Streptomyces mutabilis]
MTTALSVQGRARKLHVEHQASTAARANNARLPGTRAAGRKLLVGLGG